MGNKVSLTNNQKIEIMKLAMLINKSSAKADQEKVIDFYKQMIKAVKE